MDINGEAYFEVAKNTGKPFIVSKGAIEVEVLGTHFNVKAYDDDDLGKITLLEGRVKVSQNAAQQSQVLAPGQQALVAANGNISLLKTIDTEEVMAWKNGVFRFGDKADIQTVMRELSRWYDIDVVYQGKPNTHVGGGISRNVPVSSVLKMLQLTGSVHFSIEGRKVTIMP